MGENAPVAVSGAGAMVKLNRSIRTPKPYYFKKDSDFKTWSNMKTQPDEDENDSIDDGQVLTAERDTFQTGILAVRCCIAGKKIQDLIVDTGSAISLMSSQFYETIINGGELQPIKGQYMAANGSLRNIKESVEFTIAFDKIEIVHKFLCVDTQLSFALLGYGFLQQNKVDILTSANCLLIQNVPLITHINESRKSVSKDMGQQVPKNQTEQKSSVDEVPFQNKLYNVTAVATVTAPAVTPDAALIEKSPPTKPSAD